MTVRYGGKCTVRYGCEAVRYGGNCTVRYGGVCDCKVLEVSVL